MRVFIGGLAAVGVVLASAVTAHPAQAAAAPSPSVAVDSYTVVDPSVAVDSYTVVDLGLLPGDDVSVPFGLNSAGNVVGYSGALNQMPVPFLWTPATGIRPLTLPAGTPTGQAEAINDSGQIAGHIQPTPGHDVAVRWPATGSPQLLGSLGNGTGVSLGVGINSAGDVAVWSDAAPNEFEGQEAFLYTDATGIVSVSPGARPAFGFDVNDRQQVTGSKEFDATIWSRGRSLDISGTLSGITEGEAINASGQVAITRTLPDENSAFRWSPGVGVQSLGLDNTDEPTTAHGINAAGDVVGRGRPVASDGVMGGYVFTDATGARDLNDLLGPAFSDWYVDEAWDINDSGQIVAAAQSLTNFSVQHAVRLDPVTRCVQACLRVASLGLGARAAGTGAVIVGGRIVVLDEHQVPVPDARVSLTWTTPTGTSVGTAVTDTSGVARPSIRGPHGTYILAVTGVSKTGHTFDPLGSGPLRRTIRA